MVGIKIDYVIIITVNIYEEMEIIFMLDMEVKYETLLWCLHVLTLMQFISYIYAIYIQVL